MALESVSQSTEFLQPATAAPDSAGPTTAAPACGGCHLIADVSSQTMLQEVDTESNEHHIGRRLGVVLRGLHKHSSDSSGICGGCQWHSCNTNITASERRSIHVQPWGNRRSGRIDTVEFRANSRCCWSRVVRDGSLLLTTVSADFRPRTSPTAYNVFTGNMIHLHSPRFVLTCV